MTAQPAEPPSIFPPHWFVDNLNAAVARDWAGDGPPLYRDAFDPLVMFAWRGVHRPLPMYLLSGV